MKDKKGFLLFGAVGIIYLVLIIILLAMFIWFGFKISDTLGAVITFLGKYWMYILGFIVVVLFHKQLQAIINGILGKIGVKV